MNLTYPRHRSSKLHHQLVLQMIWRLHKRGLGVKAIQQHMASRLPMRPVPSENMISKLTRGVTWHEFVKRLDDEGNLKRG